MHNRVGLIAAMDEVGINSDSNNNTNNNNNNRHQDRRVTVTADEFSEVIGTKISVDDLISQYGTDDSAVLSSDVDKEATASVATANVTPKRTEWAVMDRVDVSNFSELVPDMAIEYPFELDVSCCLSESLLLFTHFVIGVSKRGDLPFRTQRVCFHCCTHFSWQNGDCRIRNCSFQETFDSHHLHKSH
jgi:hypothetical protein